LIKFCPDLIKFCLNLIKFCPILIKIGGNGSKSRPSLIKLAEIGIKLLLNLSQLRRRLTRFRWIGNQISPDWFRVWLN